MRADRVDPPPRFGRYTANQPAPFRPGHRQAPAALEIDLSSIGIEVRERPQQQGLAAARGTLDNDTFPSRQIELDGFEKVRPQAPNREERLTSCRIGVIGFVSYAMRRHPGCFAVERQRSKARRAMAAGASSGIAKHELTLISHST